MTTAIFTHDDCDGHVTPPGHPEQVDRLVFVRAALDQLDGLDRKDAPLGSDQDVLRCHPEQYIDKVRAAIPTEGWAALDGDTNVAPGSLNAAMRGVGGCVAALDTVLGGAASNAFVACRPPGHHAEREIAMGFCLFGNVSIAAKHALDHHGLDRVAVVDFDVHHGNGTQDLLWDENGRCSYPRTRCRFTPEPAQQTNVARMTTSSMFRCHPAPVEAPCAKRMKRGFPRHPRICPRTDPDLCRVRRACG